MGVRGYMVTSSGEVANCNSLLNKLESKQIEEKQEERENKKKERSKKRKTRRRLMEKEFEVLLKKRMTEDKAEYDYVLLPMAVIMDYILYFTFISRLLP